MEQDREMVCLQLGDEIPNFTCDSQMGTIALHDYIDGSWGIIFAFSKSNDPVSCSELGMLAKLGDEFEARNCKVVGIGVDTRSGHRTFLRETQEIQSCQVTFPVIADSTGEVFYCLGLVRPDAVNLVKGVVAQTSIFIVDIDKRIRLISQYPSVVGQNYYETLRAIDALQLATFNQVGVPANWKEGEDVFIQPHVPTTMMGQMFPKGHVEIRKWFRVTPQPDSK